MSTNHYPWNAHVLVDWLNREISKHQHSRAVAKALNLSPSILDGWIRSLNPTISLKQIHAIARYRGWSFATTVEWLGINSAHLNSLIEED